jgi:hypothetical protein
MNIEDMSELIKMKISKSEYQIKLHTLQRCNERGIMPCEIKEALLNGNIIEDYPDDNRGHSCLISGLTDEDRNIHIVCGLSEDTVWIITTYEPSPTEWETPEKRMDTK